MAITTLDGVLAGAQPPRSLLKLSTVTPIAGNVGKGFSLWSATGSPSAGAFDTTLNGVILSSTAIQVAGQIPHTDPAGNAYLNLMGAMASQACGIYLCDRVWHNGGYTITSISAQATTSPAWSARDNAGTTNGDGVLLGLEVSATVGAAAPVVTIAYTNQAGTAARSGTSTLADATFNSAVTGTFYRIGLQSGDTGVRSVQSLTLSASQLTGTINLVAYRPLAFLPLTAANTPNQIDALTAGFPRLYNGVVPFLLVIPSTAAAFTLSGQYVETQG